MFKLRLAADYLRYRLRAKSRHGTHSPFVYRLVDKVIYDFHAKKVYNDVEENDKRRQTGNRKAFSRKVSRLIYRLTADWQPQKIAFVGNIDNTTSTYLHKAAPSAVIYALEDTTDKADLILIRTDHDIYKSFVLCLPKVYERTMIIISRIYRDKQTKAEWAQIKADPRVTVTINLFAIGLVYFRKGQMKEDFTIKF